MELRCSSPGVVQGVGGWVFCTTHRSVLAAQEFDAPLHDFGSAVSVLGSFRQSISSLANLRCRAGGPLPRRALSLLRRWIETCFVRVVNLIGASASNLVTFASNFRSCSHILLLIYYLSCSLIFSSFFFFLRFCSASSSFFTVLSYTPALEYCSLLTSVFWLGAALSMIISTSAFGSSASPLAEMTTSEAQKPLSLSVV